MTLAPLAGLPGWAQEDHRAALGAVRAARPDAASGDDARAALEAAFEPVPLGPVLVTGYWEPELDGSLAPDPRLPVPLHRRPADLPLPGPTRADVMDGALAGHELAWVADPLDAFLLGVQGSGRLRLSDGSVVRLGHAGGNGHPYRSIGAALVERGAVAAGAMSADAIRLWAARHPEELPALLRLNPSYPFFRILDGLAPGAGPIGTMGLPLPAGRAVAVDPDSVPLGSALWLEAGAIRRLVVAMDTGSAIKGARVDLFAGTGTEAGALAGRLREVGALTLLRGRA